MYLIEKFERWAGIMPNPDRFKDYGPRNDFSPLYPRDTCPETREYEIYWYHCYKQDFCTRHVVLYWVFYRWWFEYHIRRLRQMGLPDDADVSNETLSYGYGGVCGDFTSTAISDAYFMKHQPTLFLLYLIFRKIAKLTEQCLTAPVKIIFKLIKRKENS